jgi:hypothetical protein
MGVPLGGVNGCRLTPVTPSQHLVTHPQHPLLQTPHHATPEPLQSPPHRKAESLRDLRRANARPDAEGDPGVRRAGVAVCGPRVGRVSDASQRTGSGRDPVGHLACERLHDGRQASCPGCPPRLIAGASAEAAAGVVRVAARAGAMRAAVRRRGVADQCCGPRAGGRLCQRRTAQPAHDPALAVAAAMGAAAAGRGYDGGGSTGPAWFTSR